MKQVKQWMPVFVAEYIADTQHLTQAEHGAYALLRYCYWRNHPLPNDRATLERIAAGPVSAAVLKFFRHEDGNLYHDHLDKLRKEQSRKHEANGTTKPGGQNGSNRRLEEEEEERGRVQKKSTEEEEDNRSLRSLVGGKNDYTPEFETFWKAYPRRIGKPRAYKAYSSAMKRTTAADVLEGVRQYPFAESTEHQPHPATWLNDDRFIPETNTRPATVRRTATKARPTSLDSMRGLFGDLSPQQPPDNDDGVIEGHAEETS